MKPNLIVLSCLSLALLVSGCKPVINQSPLTQNPTQNEASIKAERTELKISPCKYLEEAITTYANFGGTGIELDPEVNRKVLTQFFQSHPDFPKSQKMAPKAWIFKEIKDQTGALNCEYNKKVGIWKQIKIVKTKDFIVLLTADLKLATETTPVRSQDFPEITSALVETKNVKDRDLYDKLNSILN
jgi:hypothetical protein